ncbi:MAG: damage-inducible protein DinB [Segetibacter sp.]|nr:damage-inducible protein DinB [Segetibacter sp.]
MKEFFLDLFNYHYSLNKRMFELFDHNKDRVPEISIKLMCHVLNAHHLWLYRIDNKTPLYSTWDTYPNTNLALVNEANRQLTEVIIATRDFDEIINYKTSKGEHFSNSIRDILFQVVNHSTHHKAQISAQLRSFNIEPFASDYIFYKRQ